MKRLFALLMCVLLYATVLLAVPATPHLITKTQPDGSVVEYYLFGDEYFSYMVTEDGYLLTNTSSGYVEYARLTADNSIVSTGIKASSLSKRSDSEKQYLLTAARVESFADRLKSKHLQLRELHNEIAFPINKSVQNVSGNPIQKAYPLTGSPRSLVILVNFKDIKFTSSTAKDDFTRLLNEKDYAENGCAGSARDYFIASSNGKFSPTFDVYGPYNLPQNCEYYGRPVGDRHDANAVQMIIDACKAADADINFKDYDTDNDGKLDNVFVYYAGHNQAEGASDNTIWPHRSTVWSEDLRLDGVKVYDYACTSELRSRSGYTQCGIGTFCHEFGHVLSLADLYDTEYSGHQTVGSWDIMDQGSYNNDGCSPPTYSSFERFMLGWLTPEVLSEETAYTLEPLVTTNKAYMVTATKNHNLSPMSPSPNEYFMIENRRALGMDEHGIPAEGLLVTHIVFNRSNWENNTPNNDPDNMGVSIVCAAGTVSNPDMNVFPGRNSITTCNFELRDGSVINTSLFNISESGDLTSFIFGNDPTAPKLNVDKNSIIDMISYVGESEAVDSVKIVGDNLPGDLDIRFYHASRSSFLVKDRADESSKYATSIRVPMNPADSSINTTLDIKFAPKVISHDKPVEDKLIITVGNMRQDISLVGYAKAPITIYPPVAYDATDISPYSCTASWKPVKTASSYKITLYSSSEGESSEVEKFSDFEKSAPDGWTANFNTVQKSYTASAPVAVLFTKAQDELISKTYFQPLKKLSFWINAFNSTGTFKVYAKDGDGKWVEVHSEECSATTRSKIVTVNFEKEIYSQFKFNYLPTSSNGGLCFDDCTAYYSKNISLVLDKEPVTDTTFQVSGLLSGVEYRYNVVSVQSDEDHNYEYLSEPSNEIVFSTVAGASENEKELTIVRDESGYKVYVPEVLDNYYLYIYSTDGDMVSELPVVSSEVTIPRLIPGRLYIVKYAEKGNMKRKARVGKLLYLD